MVAAGWLASSALPFRFLSHCLPVAPISKQQKISLSSRLTLRCYLSFAIFTLAMSDELAQDEEDAEDYDPEALELRSRAVDDDDDASTLVGRRGPDTVSDDVVFEIGDEDGGSDDEDSSSKKRRERPSLEGAQHEREGLVRQQGRERDE
jgi:hypothetical protein